MSSDTTPTPELDLWVEERHRDIVGARFKVLRTLFSGTSEYQKVDVVESAGFGKMLFNDGLAMVSERDEFVYHEMIAHVPLFTHPEPKRVLVIGGGDGGTVREVIKHPSVEHCHLVEIDEMVVNACREHIPLTSACLNDKKVQVTIGDGVKFVAETKEKFDLIIVDSTDPIGPAAPLFGKEFYQNVHSCLADGGIVVSQGESVYYEQEMQRSLLSILNNEFSITRLFNYSNLTYPGGLWSFVYASDKRCPLADFDESRVAASGIEFQYYNEYIHRAAFMLPEFQRKALGSTLKPLPK
ncbi:MAG: polyamine aminopropyltransferase [Bdellovibrionales bacterium]|nr:polyamine aminopropyltransferase [Bdellovibrionales bacterium]